jgi:hypothetical protein
VHLVVCDAKMCKQQIGLTLVHANLRSRLVTNTGREERRGKSILAILERAWAVNLGGQLGANQIGEIREGRSTVRGKITLHHHYHAKQEQVDMGPSQSVITDQFRCTRHTKHLGTEMGYA